MKLRNYQEKTKAGILSRWAEGDRNVCAVSPTGSGKTVVMSSVINDWSKGNVVAIAHRKELVDQIAMALARNGIDHQIFGPSAMMRYCMGRQRRKLGKHFIKTNAKTVVASVDTLIAPGRRSAVDQWRSQIGLWVIDEGHHVLKSNKWGKATALFPNASGLGFTATPCRADGKGLGRHNHGLYDSLVEGPVMRELIEAGFLCDYKIYAPLTYMPLSEDNIGASGDYSQASLKAASKKSKIVGDVVTSYQKYCAGKSTVVFVTDLETAADMRANFYAAGVTAALVSANSTHQERADVLDKFEQREIDVIVNVDLLGEGFDCPGIEAVVFARPTESYGLYCQQFGRALRPLEGKQHAVIIDHVGNVVKHGLPDAPRDWTLEAKEKDPKFTSPDDAIPLRYCTNCTQPYQRVLLKCPYCGSVPKPDPRGRPEFVDGDVFEISPEVLAQLRGEIKKVDTPAEEVCARMRAAGAPGATVGNVFKQITARSEMQRALRESMAWWAATVADAYPDPREQQRLFYHTFGTDVLSAQSMGKPDAMELADRINRNIGGL